MQFPAGDLLEQRKGGNNVFKALGQEIIRDRISAVIIVSNHQLEEHMFQGAVYFKNGEPSASITSSPNKQFSIEAFEEIERLAGEASSDVHFHEANVALIYEVIDQFPHSVLSYELDKQINEDEWWRAARLNTHHMKFDGDSHEQEFIELEFARKRNNNNRESIETVTLHRGEGYWFPSSSNIFIQPILEHFQSNSFTILSIICDSNRSPTIFDSIQLIDYKNQSEETFLSEVEKRCFGVDLGCIYIQDFEMASVVYGEQFALHILRDIIDFCRAQRFILFLSYDHELTDPRTSAKISQMANEIGPVDLRSWAEDVENIPFNIEHDLYSDDEQHWFEAQLELMVDVQESKMTTFTPQEGGSINLDEHDRNEILHSMKDALDGFTNPSIEGMSMVNNQPINEDNHVSSPQPWSVQPNEINRYEGRFVSESTPIGLTSNVEVPISIRSKKKDVPKKKPRQRGVQKQTVRKPAPQLPQTSVQPTSRKEIGQDGARFDDFKLPGIEIKKALTPQSIQHSVSQQERKLSSTPKRKQPMHVRSLEDVVLQPSTNSEPQFPPEMKTPFKLPQKNKETLQTFQAEPLNTSSMSPRESSSQKQYEKSIEEVSTAWEKSELKSLYKAQTLYDEKGKKLKAFKGGY